MPCGLYFCQVPVILGDSVSVIYITNPGPEMYNGLWRLKSETAEVSTFNHIFIAPCTPPFHEPQHDTVNTLYNYVDVNTVYVYSYN